MKRFVLSVCFGCIYAVSVIVGDAASAGSTLRQGLGHAVFFGSFFVVFSLPIILVLQAGLTRLTRRIRHSEAKGVTVFEFVPITLLSLLLLSSLILETPEDQFTRFVADVQPQSVRNVRCCYCRGFGGGMSLVSFEISPSEFEEVLTRYRYEKNGLPRRCVHTSSKESCRARGLSGRLSTRANGS